MKHILLILLLVQTAWAQEPDIEKSIVEKIKKLILCVRLAA
ncbi:MAG: hypothetical protein R2877_01740 [Bdellovibrionota bacterium]